MRNMYSPAHYQESDFASIRTLIEQHSFATLLSLGENALVSHLPMILTAGANGEPELLGHMARANPHWRELQKIKRAKIIFHGPHAYISPAWYAPKPDNVPTWNYAVVHVTGTFEVVEAKNAAMAAMDRLIAYFESKSGTDWELPKDRLPVDALMSAITVFKLTGLEFTAKFKLSQKQSADDRANVAANLREAGDTQSLSLAQLMIDAKLK